MAADDTAEQQFKLAKAAYEKNDCAEAVTGFKAYLKVAEPGLEKKKSILAAIEWCDRANKKKEMLARRMSTMFVGASRNPDKDVAEEDVKPVAP